MNQKTVKLLRRVPGSYTKAKKLWKRTCRPERRYLREYIKYKLNHDNT